MPKIAKSGRAFFCWPHAQSTHVGFPCQGSDMVAPWGIQPTAWCPANGRSLHREPQAQDVRK